MNKNDGDCLVKQFAPKSLTLCYCEVTLIVWMYLDSSLLGSLTTVQIAKALNDLHMKKSRIQGGKRNTDLEMKQTILENTQEIPTNR